MIQCLSGARHTMKARLLHQFSVVGQDYTADGLPNGTWEDSQDPLTGEIVRAWTPIAIADDPTTTTINETVYDDISCVARGYSTASRFASTQVFSDNYKNIDVVRMWVSPIVDVDKGDRISHIRDQNDIELWPGIQFNVVGRTPQMGPFNTVNEVFLMLERTEV